MDEARFHRLEDMFHAATEIPSGPERDRFLHEQCVEDTELLSALRGLLSADEERMRPQGGPTPEAQPIGPLPRFGPFQAESIVGRGGVGLVYRARRDDGQFEQQVAIKLLRPGARTELFRVQFLAERRLLAQLRHPHIAGLVDGGVTPEGEPYVVMEFVDGEPLDRYCDQRRMPILERLRLFQQVLGAVDYAHRNLIVHRDLKPSNILVTADGNVKLLDFGTSKLVEDDVTTAVRALTPRYASPEQLRGETTTTAFDVFALGVILYELVVGASPFGARDSMLKTLERAVQETDPAEPASAVDAAAASARAISVPALRQELRGDLSVIMRKALAYNPARRYRSVAEMAEDVDRLLQGQPVLARPQTWRYKAGKFVRRNLLAVTAVAIALILLSGLGAYAWVEQRQALQEARRAQVMNTFLMRMFQSSQPLFGGHSGMTVLELLDRVDRQAATMLAGQPASRAELAVAYAANLVTERGTLASTPVIEEALHAARQSPDIGLQAEALGFAGWVSTANGNCELGLARVEAAADLIAQHSGQILPERRIAAKGNEAMVNGFCGNPLKARTAVQDAVKVARKMSDDSLQVSTPPAALKSATFAIAANILGCKDGLPMRKEASRIALANGLDEIEAEQQQFDARCSTAAGQLDDAIEHLGRSVQLFARSVGPENELTRAARAHRAFLAAQAGQNELAAREAHQSLDGLHCDRLTAACGLIKGYVSQTFFTIGMADDSIRLARQIAAENSKYAIIGQAVLFATYTQSNQPALAAPYRQGAEKFLPAIPAALPWHARLQAALDHAHPPR